MKYIDTFSTENGTKYVYDGTTNIVLPISDTLYKTINEAEELDYSLIENNADEHTLAVMKRWKLFRKNTCPNISNDFITSGIIEYPYPQLILGITENCNLRCKYCIFSGNYADMRTHKLKSMAETTAIESVDIFINLQLNNTMYCAGRECVISFYGGEPLLNIDLIQKVVSYIKEKGFKAIFALTTNGTLLNEKIIRYLVLNNFLVSISLDGSEYEHNRNRVFKNNHGTHDIVMNNISALWKEIERQNKADLLPIHILTCYDEETDLVKVNDFFISNNILKKFSGRVSPVIPAKEVYTNKTIADLYQRYISDLKKQSESGKTFFGDRLFGSLFNTMLNRNMTPYGDGLTTMFGSACIPGGKIYVDTDGRFHPCEKMNPLFPIGDSKSGIDTKAIKKLMIKWSSAYQSHCASCAYKSICGACYANCSVGSEFNIEKLCQKTRPSIIRRQLAELYSLMEYDPEIISNHITNREMINSKYLKVIKTINSC